MKHSKLLASVTAAGILTALTLSLTSSHRSSQTAAAPAPEAPVMLNSTLENSLSDLPETEGMDRKIENYLKKWEIRGASLAIMRNDSLVYAKGYGWADKEKGIRMEPGHILRMASVSKLITATGIMVLCDRGLLHLEDTVFGPSGILDSLDYTSVIKDPSYRKITVEHLLRHQGGFYRDPLFSSNDVRVQMGLDHAPVAEDFYRLVLRHPLKFAPGSWQRYSNFGYLLLCDIISKVSGQDYEQFIREEVLRPAGCFDMHIAGNYYEDKRPNEVRYYTHEGDGKYVSEYNGSGKTVERCYGGNNITLLSGAGGWCASPSEIARLVAAIDGRDEVPDIISKEAVGQMVRYIDQETFSLGWNDTDPGKGWTRTGTLAGTSALVRYFPDGECWVMITNTSTWKGYGFTKYTDALFKECRSLYSGRLPHRNLFYSGNILSGSY
ncbi:MAG: serine hydrolase domain-containing protein [Candidatus Cryptobacteroides sp.]